MRNQTPAITHTQLMLLCILCCGLLLRLQNIALFAYNPDELMHLAIARGDTLREVWQRGLQEAHPPLGHLLRHITLMLFPGFAAERTIALCFGMLTIGVFFAIGHLLGGRNGGLAMGFLCMSSPLMIEASQMMRNYALFMLLLGGGFYCYLRYHRDGRSRDLCAFSLCMTLACATHFSGFIAGAILGLHATSFTLRHGPKRLLPLIVAYLPMGMLGVVCYTLYFAPGTAGHGWQQHYQSIGKLYTLSAQALLENVLLYFDIWKLHERGAFLMGNTKQPLWFIAVFCTMFYAYVKATQKAFAVAPGTTRITLLFWPVAVGLAACQLYPFLPSRHALYALPFFLLPIPIALASSNRQPVHRVWLVTLAACAAITSFHLTHARYQDTLWDYSLPQTVWEAGLREVGTHVAKGEPVIVNRFTSLYIDNAIDGNRADYNDARAMRTRRYEGVSYITNPKRYYWTYTSGHFAALARAALDAYPNARNVWVMMLNDYGWDLFPFHDCMDAAGQVTQTVQVNDEITLYAIPREALEQALRAAPGAGRCVDVVKPAP